MTLKEFIENFENIVMVDPGVITLETVLDELEDWDSLSQAAFLALCEDELGIKVSDQNLRESVKFSDLVELVKEKLQD
ncbi:hypothetical protein CD30_13755 [Ureibacillus massiliensis 4400831 = CIP 108448 = CCUG 49529]|uniref:Carrier domain-containing protein n=1 Tax=Ureibacillus massiliensis 4400831 = CIP 108448 = CCUG 49529 TaxID=1211035 RepID=A0A0A3J4C9_9BACL|nr:acyl carrier protein [Ureibacillus massiliensis]KGR90038.1 hypothetical protein CD30_13755 [Ureibacillus massiliensis 4400831 = CIP 108448 = CCUG 49529]